MIQFRDKDAEAGLGGMTEVQLQFFIDNLEME